MTALTTAPKSIRTPRKNTPRTDAEALARKQRDISVSEFFAKNRHLLGFDNPRKALLTTVKEAVDNALDACEEAGILPDIFVAVDQLGETRFRVTVRDNGPGIVRAQVENIFGRLLYGSKFHRLKMSRGQQGIGISAAGMYGLMTTGKPVVIHTRPKKNKPCHRVVLAIDTQKNRAEVTDEEELDFTDIPETGTQVEIELEGRYNKGRASVDEFLELTAIANPHAQIIFRPPAGQPAKLEDDAAMLIEQSAETDALKIAEETDHTTVTAEGLIVFPRAVEELPVEAKEIKPHPVGIELGTLLKMTKTTEQTKLGGFLQEEFCRVSPKICGELCSKIGRTGNTYVSTLSHDEVEKLYRAIQETRFMAPPTDCLAPIGAKQLLAGLLKGVKAEFFTAVTREPAVYRGNPFQIEVGLAYGGDLPADEPGRVIRFANRVPLLYQQSACCTYKAVVDTGWRNYSLSQPKDALPVGPLVIVVHMASVWVPFTSESKEAIADYDEIRKEIKLALAEAGRKLKTYLGRRAKMRREADRRDVFHRYIREVVNSLHKIQPKLNPDKLFKQFEKVAKARTEAADMQFDEDGNPIAASERTMEIDHDEHTVILEDAIKGGDEPQEAEPIEPAPKRRASRNGDEEDEGLFE